MFAQLIHFDGPRSPELVAASDRASRERIQPAVARDPEVRAAHVATFVLRQPDGGEVVVLVSESEAALRRAQEVAMATELLPGEDPALLPGPDRIDTYEVVLGYDRHLEQIGATS